jgi:rubrerythrin
MSTDELNILKKAILIEAEGENFYQLAAVHSSNHDVKNAFLFLAEEEKQHGMWLRQLMQSLAPGNNFDIKQLENDADIDLPAIFDFSKLKGQQKNTLEISVFHIGILMEKASLDYYREAAEKSTNQDAKKLYGILSKWEMHHLDELEKVYDSLTEDWFDHQSFSPS